MGNARSLASRYLCLDQLEAPRDAVHQAIGSKAFVRPGQTQRQWAEQVAEDTTCAACHYALNGLAFPLQQGADGLEPLDTSGWLDANLDGKPEAIFDDIDGLAQALAQSPEAQACFARKWLEFLTERQMQPVDACSVETLAQKLWRSGGDIYEMILDSVELPAFRLVPTSSNPAPAACQFTSPALPPIPQAASVTARRARAAAGFGVSQLERLSSYDRNPCFMKKAAEGFLVLMDSIKYELAK